MKKLSFLICLTLISGFAFSQWTWQNPLPQGNALNSVCFTDANTGYVVGDCGTIVKTTNGGIGSVEEPGFPESTFTIYPNPANNKITIVNNAKIPEETIISIFNIQGVQILQDKFRNKQQMEMDVSALTKGIYLVKIETTVGIESKKLVMQ